MKRVVYLLGLLVLVACSDGAYKVPDASLSVASFGSSSDDFGTSVAKHSAGVYVVANTDGNLDGTNLGSRDVVLRKYRTDGSVAWARHFGTSGLDEGFGVAADANSNAYVVGSVEGTLAGTAPGSWYVFVRKVSPSGATLWTRQFGTAHFDVAEGVAVLGNAVYVVGRFGKGFGSDAFIRKLNASGSTLWTRTLTVTNSTNNGFMAVALDSSGNAYAVGHSNGALAGSYGGGLDMVIFKFSPSGSVLWKRQLHYGRLDIAYGVAVSGSSVYVAGRDGDDARVVKFTTSGSKVWEKRFGVEGTDAALDIQASAQAVFFVGHTQTNVGPVSFGGRDGYLVKLDPAKGFLTLGKQIGSSGSDVANALALTANGVFVTGETDGTIGSANRGGNDAFMMRLDAASGNTLFTDQ